MAFTIENLSDKIEIVEKPKGALRLPPNLEGYDAAYSSFTWEQAQNEISRFADGKINAAYNAVDKHINTSKKDKVALHWISENGEAEAYTFSALSSLTNKFSNALKSLDIQRQDRIFIFLPRIPELYISFLGIVKFGAIASTLFAAFGSEALKDRLHDGQATALITTPEYLERVRPVLSELPHLKHIIVVDDRSSAAIDFASDDTGLLRSYSKMMNSSSDKFEAAEMEPTDYSFMLYTSGSTGKPKGVVHRHQAILQQHLTTKWILDLKDDDIYWCTADPGWVTGIVYGIFGPWSNGITSIVYGGRYDADNWYKLIQDYKVTVWYTAPTAIRMLMKDDGNVTEKYDFSSLRHILSVGEPLNPEAIRWGLKAFGLPFHDTWWQTETGSILISNFPTLPIKLGSMGKPIPGISAAIVDDDGNVLPSGNPGNLAIKHPWPSIMGTVWHNETKYNEYFKGQWYLSGDKAYMDSEGYYWFIGRADDVIKTSGERVGPFEVESSLVEHPAVAEAGVIGKPDMLRGEIIKAFVVLNRDVNPSDELKDELKKHVKLKLAGHAYPREIDFVKSLPKTQSGKIMRRVLKARELGLPTGDLSTIEET